MILLFTVAISLRFKLPKIVKSLLQLIQLKKLELFKIEDVAFGTLMPFPLTTVKLLLSTVTAGCVDRTLSLYVPAAKLLGNTPLIAGT